ncbi:HAD family hydrolase [Paenibacillus sp. SI8]|uniref:HAD family hydrolase n=1 Tax=unclassified Paenibacillus TaxID=185978 RepID=UPI0034656C05
MKAFIFDMDGVIIDSEPIHFEVDVKTMAYLGVNIHQEQLEKYVGMTNPEMWRLIKQEYKLANPVDEIIDYQLSTKIALLKNLQIEPIEGIPELLQTLRNHQIPIAIASSSPRKFIEEVLAKFGLSNHFACVVSGEEVNEGKPAPDVYLETAKILGVDPAHCVVLEDSKNGVSAAKAAGMTCIGYINPNSGNQNLSVADWVVDAVKDINMEELLRG